MFYRMLLAMIVISSLVMPITIIPLIMVIPRVMIIFPFIMLGMVLDLKISWIVTIADYFLIVAVFVTTILRSVGFSVAIRSWIINYHLIPAIQIIIMIP